MDVPKPVLLPPLTVDLLFRSIAACARYEELSAKIKASDYDPERDGSLFDLIVMPFGKPLGDCTGEEAGIAAEWYNMLAAKFGNRTMREVLSTEWKGEAA